MKTSCICSYVHYRKPRRSLQGHSGSFISRDGAFREVMWKVEAKIQASGGTPRKNRTCRTPMALGSGAAPSAMHTLARRTWVRRRAAAPMAIAPGCGRGHADPQESPAAGEANGAHHGAPRPVHQRGDEGGHTFHDRFPVAFECLEKRFWHVGVDGRRPQPVIQEDGVLSIAVLLLANSLGLYFNAMGQGLWIGQSLAPVDKPILGSRNFKRSYPKRNLRPF